MTIFPYNRMDRVNELLLEEIAKLLQREIKDPRIGFVSVTRVETNRDLREARVYVSVFGKEANPAEALQGLQSAAGYIRHQLFRRLSMKSVPKLSFVLDDSIAHGAHIASLLKELEEEGEEAPAGPDDGPEGGQ